MGVAELAGKEQGRYVVSGMGLRSALRLVGHQHFMQLVHRSGALTTVGFGKETGTM